MKQRKVTEQTLMSVLFRNLIYNQHFKVHINVNLVAFVFLQDEPETQRQKHAVQV